MMLQLDLDSQETYRPDGITLHDYDRRFDLEDRGMVPTDRRFRWSMISPV